MTSAKGAPTRIGAYGEEVAVRYLRRAGYRIRHRNWKADRYELDVVAVGDGCTAIVEVKTRRLPDGFADRFGTPGAAVTPEKQRRICEAAAHYRTLHRPKLPLRFDVIEIYLDPESEKPVACDIRHIRDAFR